MGPGPTLAWWGGEGDALALGPLEGAGTQSRPQAQAAFLRKVSSSTLFSIFSFILTNYGTKKSTKSEEKPTSPSPGFPLLDHLVLSKASSIVPLLETPPSSSSSLI